MKKDYFTKDVEKIFIETFVASKFKTFFLTKIKSKKRNIFLGRLYYKSPIFKPKLEYIDIESNISKHDLMTILGRLKQEAFYPKFYCVSYYENLDKKEFDLEEAAEAILQSSMPMIIILSPSQVIASFEATDSNVSKRCIMISS